MERQGNEVHLDPSEARAATGPRSMRTVLVISLALIVFAFAVIWASNRGKTGAVEGSAQPAAAASPAHP